MFQSVLGQSSEQNIAHYRSRPSVAELEIFSDTISNALESWSTTNFRSLKQTPATATAKILNKYPELGIDWKNCTIWLLKLR